jgi:hypothetical protein
MFASSAATEPPAAAAEIATEAPAAILPPAAATEAPVEEPSVAIAPLSTATAAVEDSNSTRVRETAVSKQAGTEAANAASSGLAQEPLQVTVEPTQGNTVSPTWQWLLAGIALISLFVMAVMRQLSISRWRSRT